MLPVTVNVIAMLLWCIWPVFGWISLYFHILYMNVIFFFFFHFVFPRSLAVEKMTAALSQGGKKISKTTEKKPLLLHPAFALSSVISNSKLKSKSKNK